MVKTLEELQGALADAQLEFDQTNAALQILGPDGDETTRKDLEAKFTKTEAEVRTLASDIDRLVRMDKALKAVPRNEGSDGSVVVGKEPRTYERGFREVDGTFRSFFRDLYREKQGDYAAASRIAKHSREVAIEQRAAISTSSGGVGLVPPQYLLDDLATFARSSRPFADALGPRPLPETGMTFNVPRVTTGALAAVKTEGSAVQVGSAVTDYLSFSVNTVAGLQDISRELLDRSDPATDQVLGQDLSADYAKKLDTQLLNQTTNGITLLTGTNAVTYTQASPTAITLYPKFAAAISAVWTNRFAAPDLIVMHPRRWAQLLGGTDSTGRPLVLPDTGAGVQAFNLMSRGDGSTPQGLVGQIQGLPVVVDPNIVTNLGAGTNQDTIIVTRRADQLFFEVGTPTVAVETGVLSGNLQVRIYAYGYFAFTFARYAAATSIIDGTGLITPTFA
jgi:HK97 family phage major capsid protein